MQAPPAEPLKLLEGLFIFSLIWSVGATTETAGRTLFNLFLRKLLRKSVEESPDRTDFDLGPGVTVSPPEFDLRPVLPVVSHACVILPCVITPFVILSCVMPHVTSYYLLSYHVSSACGGIHLPSTLTHDNLVTSTQSLHNTDTGRGYCWTKANERISCCCIGSLSHNTTPSACIA